ncbi:hypothetical protein [Nocardiopsis oceani]
MGYRLDAVVAEAPLLRCAIRGLARARPVALHQDLGLLPVTCDLVDQDDDIVVDDPPGFLLLTDWLVERIAACSARGPLAYLEADFFGGVGSQQAVVWERGEIVLGPLHLPVGASAPASGSPLSQALRYLGVATGPGDHDEFDASGLGTHRSSEKWVEFGASLPGD